jgi:transcriptional regulator with XRE-family HTH domain
MGERVRLARLRRRMSASTVAARAGITRSTLYRVEEGDPGVSLGTYASVLKVLGLHSDLELVAKDDVLGRKVQDLNLPLRRRAPKRKAHLLPPPQPPKR